MPASNSESEEDMIIKISYYGLASYIGRCFRRDWFHVVMSSSMYQAIRASQAFLASSGSQRLLLTS
jgi:hypothetical protein